MFEQTAHRIMMISTHGYVAAKAEFGKPDTGGQVVYVLELSKCLARMGFEVDIYTRQFEDQPAEEQVSPGVRILRFPCGGPDFIPKETLYRDIPEWVDNALAFINKSGLEYDFVNSHYWDAGVAGRLVADALSIGHVHTPHSLGAWKRANMDGDAAELEEKYNFNARIAEEKRVFHASDCVVATTPQQRKILLGDEYEMSEDQLQVIPPGFDDTRFYPVSDATRDALKHKLDAHGKVVLALGRMARNKGYDLLVRAAPAFLKRVPDARLMLAVGSNNPPESERKMVQELKDLAAELGIADRVIFRSHIPDSQLADYYRMADVFALCSRYEPFGMTAIEAMACGTPTVVTTEGGLWQDLVWGVEALYANPFDPEAYGHAIAMILQHEEISHRLQDHGAGKARGKYTWSCVAQQILSLLDVDAPFKGRVAEKRAAKARQASTAGPEDGSNSSQENDAERIAGAVPVVEAVLAAER